MPSFADLKAQREARSRLPFAAKPSVQKEETPVSKPSTSTLPSSAESHHEAAESIRKSSSANSSDDTQRQAKASRKLLDGSHVEVRSESVSGRGLFYSPQGSHQPLPPCSAGSVLLRLQPDVAVLSTSLLGIRCSGCFCDASPSAAGLHRVSSTVPQTGLQRCSGCKIVKYCSTHCQKIDWSGHKEECKALRSLQQLSSRRDPSSSTEADEESNRQAGAGHRDQAAFRVPSATLRAMARWAWMRRRLFGGAKPSADADLSSNRAELSSHQLEAFGQLSLRLAYYLTAAARTDGLNRTNANTDSVFSDAQALQAIGIDDAAELLEVVIQFTTNSFALTDSDLSCLGICLDTRAAMLNHSCVPNAAIVFPFAGQTKKMMHLVALKTIEPGEELLVSYVDVADTHQARQQQLQERYHFQCRCKLCKMTDRARRRDTNKWVDPREAMWCSKRCGGWVSRPDPHSTVPAACTLCNTVTDLVQRDIDDDTATARNVLEEATRPLDAGDAEAAWTKCSSLLPRLVERYAPSCQPLFHLLRLGCTALIEVGSKGLPDIDAEGPEQRQLMQQRYAGAIRSTTYCFEEAMQLQMLVVAGVQASRTPIYEAGHPARGIAIATLAKLILAQLSQRPEAAEARLLSPSSGESLTERRGGVASLLKNPITIPAERRLQVARQLLIQAIEELAIGFGRSNQGGKAGQEMRMALKELEQEAAMLV